MRVFVSYSHKDDMFAKKIRKWINALQIDTWMDEDGIPKDSNWDDSIDEALNNLT